ncbi:MAG: sugar ABC transporter permease [Candidatus Nanopelagicales bacterium]|jgi:arabinogalactan oligomer/maltooligosaccharide transport system permease protein
MTATIPAPAPEAPVPTRQRRTFGAWLRIMGWRHLVALLALVVALFPVLWVISAAFTHDPSISSGAIVPTNPTMENFTRLFGNPDQPYLNWYVNTMVLATLVAVMTVLIAGGAAYAFSRFRFKGRKVGLMFLLLVQMFPQFLSLTAIYIIMVNIGDVFPPIGLDSLAGLGLVYLGGAMGVNAWLIKGFFDTIPMEIDESAKVDGATHGQVFWGIILPLAVPVLAVVGLLSFIGTISEFIIASALIQDPGTKTLAVGLYGYIANEYSENWGPFCAGALLAAIPVVIVFMFLQRFIVSGLTAGSVKG